MSRVGYWELPTNPEAIEVFYHGFSEATQGRVPANLVFPLELVMRELVNNAYLHGNKGDESKKIVVELGCGTQYLRLRVVDEGSGFKFRGKPQVPDVNATSGRGMLIAHEFAHRVRHNMAGNEVEFWMDLRGLS